MRSAWAFVGPSIAAWLALSGCSSTSTTRRGENAEKVPFVLADGTTQVVLTRVDRRDGKRWGVETKDGKTILETRYHTVVPIGPETALAEDGDPFDATSTWWLGRAGAPRERTSYFWVEQRKGPVLAATRPVGKTCELHRLDATGRSAVRVTDVDATRLLGLSRIDLPLRDVGSSVLVTFADGRLKLFDRDLVPLTPALPPGTFEAGDRFVGKITDDNWFSVDFAGRFLALPPDAVGARPLLSHGTLLGWLVAREGERGLLWSLADATLSRWEEPRWTGVVVEPGAEFFALRDEAGFWSVRRTKEPERDDLAFACLDVDQALAAAADGARYAEWRRQYEANAQWREQEAARQAANARAQADELSMQAGTRSACREAIRRRDWPTALKLAASIGGDEYAEAVLNTPGASDQELARAGQCVKDLELKRRLSERLKALEEAQRAAAASSYSSGGNYSSGSNYSSGGSYSSGSSSGGIKTAWQEQCDHKQMLLDAERAVNWGGRSR